MVSEGSVLSAEDREENTWFSHGRGKEKEIVRGYPTFHFLEAGSLFGGLLNILKFFNTNDVGLRLIIAGYLPGLTLTNVLLSLVCVTTYAC